MEVMVSLTILGVGILAVLEGFSISMRAATRNVRLGEAAEIAQRELALAVTSTSPSPGEARKASAGLYTWTISYRDKPLGLACATVAVSWPDRGQTQTFELSELFQPQQPASEATGQP